MSPSDKQKYYDVMNAACDAMIASSQVMGRDDIPLAKRLELREQLQDRAVKLKELALKLGASSDTSENG